MNNVLEDNGAMGDIIVEYSALHQQICKLMQSILEHSEELQAEESCLASKVKDTSQK